VIDSMFNVMVLVLISKTSLLSILQCFQSLLD